MVKARITHSGHGDQKFAGQVHIVLLFVRLIPPNESSSLLYQSRVQIDVEVIPNRRQKAYVRAMNIPIARLMAAALFALSSSAAVAQAVPDNLIQAEILPGWRTDSGTQMAAIRITLAPGWKTYWRAPGDSGIPPNFDWSGSSNLQSVTYHWPKPQVFDLNGLQTLAYLGGLILPVEFTPARVGQAVRVTVKANIGVCEEICVPVSFTVNGDLPADRQPDPAIVTALADGPTDGKARGLAKPRCAAEPIRDGMRLSVDIALPEAAKGDFAVIEPANDSIWVSRGEVRAGGGHLIQTSDLVPADAKPFVLDRSSLRMTLFTGSGDVIELTGCAG